MSSMLWWVPWKMSDLFCCCCCCCYTPLVWVWAAVATLAVKVHKTTAVSQQHKNAQSCWTQVKDSAGEVETGEDETCNCKHASSSHASLQRVTQRPSQLDTWTQTLSSHHWTSCKAHISQFLMGDFCDSSEQEFHKCLRWLQGQLQKDGTPMSV